MEKCKLIHFIGRDYTCERNCYYYGSVACKLHKETCKGNPYNCSFFNPTYGTLVNEIAEIKDLIDEWNFD